VKTLTVAEIARAVHGTVDGDPSVCVSGVAGLAEAEAGNLSFLANPKYSPMVGTTRASAVIVAEGWEGARPCVLIRVKSPDRAFTMAAVMLGPEPVRYPPGVHPAAVVAPDAVLGVDVGIGPGCVVEAGASIGDRTVLVANCYVGHRSRVGQDCRLYPNASLREDVVVGDRVILHNGAVIGSDGFGYYPQGDRWMKIPQTGTVVVGNDVEIGANTTVDRARFGKTVIADGVKIDNLVQVAHNVRIGENTAIAAQCGMAGSAVIGRNVQLAGQSAVTGHVTVGDRTVVLGKGSITKSVPAGSIIGGHPGRPQDEWHKTTALVNRLPEMRAQVLGLVRRIAALEARMAAEATDGDGDRKGRS
jgi:UDP-3-O-[3-hydroxymyristoyl] glucosamine N-acyltransferase